MKQIGDKEKKSLFKQERFYVKLLDLVNDKENEI